MSLISATSVFFPEDFDEKFIKLMIRKNVDVVLATREEAEKRVKGKAVLCVDDDEMDKVSIAIQNTKEYYIAGEDTIQLLGTPIIVDALIVDKI